MKKWDRSVVMFAAMVAVAIYAIWAWRDVEKGKGRPYEPMDEINKIVNP